MLMMLKDNDNLYSLLHQHPKEFTKFAILSTLNKAQYDFMLEHLRKMRDGNKVGDCYVFPRPDNGVYTIVRINHVAQDHYVVDANLHHIFSDMVDIEFAMTVFDLECLVNHQAQTPVYFSPPKDKSNDR